MAFADPEHTAAFLAGLEAEYGPRQNDPGAISAAARGLEAYKALCEWLWTESAARTDFPDIVEAAASIAGSFIGSVAFAVARPGAELDVCERVATRALTAAALSVELGSVGFVQLHEGHKQ